MIKLLTYHFPLSWRWLIVPYCFGVSLFSSLLISTINLSIFPITSWLFNSQVIYYLIIFLIGIPIVIVCVSLDLILLAISIFDLFPLLAFYILILFWLIRMLVKAWQEMESKKNRLLKLFLFLIFPSISILSGFTVFVLVKNLLPIKI